MNIHHAVVARSVSAFVYAAGPDASGAFRIVKPFPVSLPGFPLGDLSGTLLSLMLTNPLFPDFLFEGKSPKGEGSFDTREVRQALGSDIPFNEPSVAAWLKEALDEEMNTIFGGVWI